MYDTDKIIPGLIILLLLIASPLIYTVVKGKASYVPELEIVTEEKQCVESAEYMRKEHMNLLKKNWRERVVHQGVRTYVASDGREYKISLTSTCLGCHPNKANFCDRCHNYVAVKPVCWNCHNIPEGEE